jgi:hypothetical protein
MNLLDDAHAVGWIDDLLADAKFPCNHSWDPGATAEVSRRPNESTKNLIRSQSSDRLSARVLMTRRRRRLMLLRSKYRRYRAMPVGG